MTYRSKLFIISFLAIYLSVSAVREAHAYLDPGTGSYIIQIVIAGIFVGWFSVKYLLRKIMNFFSGLFSPRKKDNAKNNP